jgi:hypothetical protein
MFFNVAGTLIIRVFDVYSWIRHGCVGGGFYYSPTHKATVQVVGFNSSYWPGMQTQRLVKPAGGCFQASTPLGISESVLSVEAGLGAGDLQSAAR